MSGPEPGGRPTPPSRRARDRRPGPVDRGRVLQPLGPAGEQGGLFPDDLFGEDLHDEVLGSRGPAACQIVGITYGSRLLGAHQARRPQRPDRDRVGLAAAVLLQGPHSAQGGQGLLDTGVSLNNIRSAVEQLRRHGVRDLARIAFSPTASPSTSAPRRRMSSTSPGGQGVFGSRSAGRCASCRAPSRASRRSGPGPVRVVDQAHEDEPRRGATAGPVRRGDPLLAWPLEVTPAPRGADARRSPR